MIDITTIQTFPVAENLKILQERIDVIKTANNQLIDKNERLQKIVIVSVITIGLLTAIVILKQKTKTYENSNH